MSERTSAVNDMNHNGMLNPLRGKQRYRDFAVYDLETLPSLDKVYLLGFYDGEQYRYFESKPLEPSQPGSPVDAFCQWMFLDSGTKYCKRWLYAHNGGNFDVLYILKWLMRRGREFGLSFEVTPIQSSMLSVTVRRRGSASRMKNGQYKWTFLDSIRLMPGSLESLAQSYGLEGKVRGVDYATLHEDPRRYEYLEQDCRLLYDVLSRFHASIITAGGEVGVTAPSTAMASYRRTFQPQPIPSNRHFGGCDDDKCLGCLHAFVRRGYYGGRTEVFRERFHTNDQTLNYYDVNSMYPAAMLEPVPCEFVTARTGPVDLGRYTADWLGFVEATVTVPKSTYVPALPYRQDKTKRLIFPVGRFTGVWTSAEIMAARRDGYLIEQHRSIWFRGRPLFRDFILHWYKLRDKKAVDYSPAMSLVAKLLMNSLYGKFGTNENRERLWFDPSDDDVAESEFPMVPMRHNLDILKQPTRVEASYIIPHISAWITSLARVKLYGLLTDCLKAGKGIWYCDTDSLVTNATLPTSDELGALKLEGVISRAWFVAPKMYIIDYQWRDGKGKQSVEAKAKGFGGFGRKGVTQAEFADVIKSGTKIGLSRITKFREGLRNLDAFPSMSVVQKGVNKKRRAQLDLKRIHTKDGETTPIVIE